jgi:alpha-beta hydrolase superfamily lysophospholipase
MQISEWTWKSFDGLDMYARGWAPQGKPRAAIMLVHGHGEHVVRYDHVAAALTKKGYAVLGFDLRGHGKSGGPRGNTPSYKALLDDISAFSLQVDERYAGVPRFLYGHSMGGNLVINYTLRRKPDLRGVIATSPWLKLAFTPPAVQVILARVVGSITPKYFLHSPVDAANLSHDQKVVSAYEKDPLVHDIITARLLAVIHDSGLWALEHASEFPLPLLLMHGAADPITSARASREFAQKAGDKVTLKEWDGLYHEIHNEPEQEQIFAYMLDRLEKFSQN